MGGGTKQGNNSARGTLTVTARVSNGSSRYAMPSIPNLVYAALLYKDGDSPATPSSTDFVKGTKVADSDNLIFSFQKPENTSGNFTLEVFAFVKADDGTANFSRSGAPFSKAKAGLKIIGDAIDVGDIALEVNNSSEEKGTVALQIKVPEGCSLIIDDMTNFAITGTSPNFTVTQNGTGISAGTYPVNFTVKKIDGDKTETVYIFAESINVLPGLCTDTWWNGNVSSEIKDVAQSMSTTLYVRGTGGWYDNTSPYKDGTTAAASDDNLGSFSSPLATIQKAIDTVIAINDGSPYTICVDGTLTQSEEARMATFSALKTELTLTIKALSGTATLDGGARLDADGNVTEAGSKQRIINTSHGTNGILNLTLENLVITGGTSTGHGGGIYIEDSTSTLKMKGCTVEGNAATGSASYAGGIYVSSGELSMEGCTISGNASKSSGGGVYVASGILKTEKCVFSGNISNGNGGAIYIYTNAEATMTDDEIKGNKAKFGGGMYVNGGTLTMKNCKVEGNIATSYYMGGIAVWGGGTVSMDGGTVSGNRVEGSNSSGVYGGGVYVSRGTFTMKGDATISGNILTDTATNRQGGEVYVSSGGTFEMEGGTISGGNAKLGGGVYVAGSASNFKMSGGTITGNTATASGGGVYVEGGTFTMTGGTIDGNSATTQGSGVYITATSSANSVMGTFNMIGSAKVAEDNDVYLSKSGSNVATITVAGDLTADSPVATITPSAYEARQVLSADGTKVTAITQDICDKFALSPNPAGGIWQIVPDGTGANGVLTRPDTIYLNSSNGSDTNSGLTASKAVQTLSKAIELYDTYNAEKIMVCAAYTLPSGESGLLDRAGKTKVTLMRYDGSSDVSDALTGNTVETGSMLLIYQGDVTISNVMLDGNKENVSASGSLLYIDGSDTIVTLGDDATLCNNKTSFDAGGVYVYKSTFKMTGGAITGNETDRWGGGVYMENSATFEMSDGEISDNHANYSGGGGWLCGFNMSGGTIRNNTANWGGGVAISRYSVRDSNMTGGKIIKNTATTLGGGVIVYGTFEMSGGEITGNTAANNGGGVYKEASGTFTQTGTGGTVHDNTPNDIYNEPSS